LIFPTREDIVKLNRRHIERTKGLYVEPDNLKNPGSLEWVLEAIQYPLFGVEKYLTLPEKAAVLAWTIIKNHVFHDGCKRTGMSALEIFVEQNDHQLNATNDEIEDVALKVAGAEAYSFDEFAEWVRGKISPKDLDADLWHLLHTEHVRSISAPYLAVA
jgi:death-on-curing protein